jgi:HTH-type transcriptional regulator/antitoxin HigA
MEIKPIRSEEEHGQALRAMERLWGAKAQTRDGDRLDVLALLLEAYEKAHWPIDPPDPIDAIKFRLEQQGLDERALVGVIGTRSRVHEVLHGRRKLSLPMIRRLHERFGIPAEILISPTGSGRRMPMRRANAMV